jgi:carbonic anhydrase/acetyltransferase-like protein (isoleucine patch superfamily)
MATLVELDGVSPTIGEDVYLAPTAVLIGDVRVGDRASIWFGAVLRGDSSHIEVGAESSIQDNVVIHCAKRLPTVVGARVTVGHGALLEGCVIEDEALIGMGAIVLQHALVRAGALVAAGSVVPERAEVPSGVLVAGVPAQHKKQLSGSALAWTSHAADEYQQYRMRYLTASRVDDANVA